MENDKKHKIEKFIHAINKSIRKIYEEAAIKKQKLPVADIEGNVSYIDPQTVL